MVMRIAIIKLIHSTSFIFDELAILCTKRVLSFFSDHLIISFILINNHYELDWIESNQSCILSMYQYLRNNRKQLLFELRGFAVMWFKDLAM